MKYPSHPDYKALLKVFKSYCEMKHEHGSTQVPEVIAQVHKAINKGISDIQKVSIDKKLAAMEPNKLEDIQALRPKGPRKIWESFDKRRLIVYNRLEEIGFDVVKPVGAFYIMPSTTKFNLRGVDFSRKIMKEQAVAIVPGSIFGSFSDDMIRISYATEIGKLEEAMDRIEKFVNQL